MNHKHKIGYMVCQLQYIGNIGPYRISIPDGQPEYGFSNENEARSWLYDQIAIGYYPFTRSTKFTIQEVITVPPPDNTSPL